MPGHCCIAARAGEALSLWLHRNETENPHGKGSASNSANKHHPGQEQMDSHWTGAYQRALVSKLLLQRAYTKNTDQEIKQLDKPSTQLIQLVKNIKDISTSASTIPSSSWPASSVPLPQAAPSVITFFPSHHEQPGDEAIIIQYPIIIPSVPPLWTLKVILSPSFPILS